MHPNNKLSLCVQYANEGLKDKLSRVRLRRWVKIALVMPCEITLRIVEENEGRTLNRAYRGKDYATNVLTFVYDENPQCLCCADIVLCSDVLIAEAIEQRKSLLDHAAHLVIHGVLHAQGYDHMTDEQAQEMEVLEIAMLGRLGIANPFL